MKLSSNGFLSKCDQILSFQRIWSHILKKSLKENFNFRAVFTKINVKDPRFSPFLELLFLQLLKKRCSAGIFCKFFEISKKPVFTENFKVEKKFSPLYKL